MRKWSMNRSIFIRRGVQCALAAITAIVVLAVILAIALDRGFLRGALLRSASARAGRAITVQGSFRVHLLSFHPHLIAEDVEVGNPSWMPAGTAAEIKRFALDFEWPRFGHSFRIVKLEATGAMLHLSRDSSGHSNWQWALRQHEGRADLPIIRSLKVPSAHVVLDDQRRHLQFDGVVTVEDGEATEGLRPLRLEGAGQLNGRDVTVEIIGDPLAQADHAKPYGFRFSESSSGSRLIGHGSLPQPFDFTIVETTFEATGADLKDLYFLTGVTLINTGGYHLTGRMSRHGPHSEFSDLVATTGQSDIRGTVSIQSTHGRPAMTAEFNSEFLRLADLGLRAAGRDPGTGPHLLLSDVPIKPSAVRHGDAAVDFHARRVDVGRISLHSVAAKMIIDHGHVVVGPLSADILEGKLLAYLKTDATTDTPATDVDIKINGLQLAELNHKGSGPPPFEGLMRARIAVSGHGTSLHQVAASANGTVTAVWPHGTIRESFAEVTGINLHELGLLLTKSTVETAIRCGVASFKAHDGTLTAQSVVADTDPVLIYGDGQIRLDTEALDLVLHGHPKHLRLFRVRSAVLVRGTLAHRSISLQVGDPAARMAESNGIGVLLTPLPEALAFVDPALAKDADCAALLGSQ
jgi:AsmA family protein